MNGNLRKSAGAGKPSERTPAKSKPIRAKSATRKGRSGASNAKTARKSSAPKRAAGKGQAHGGKPRKSTKLRRVGRAESPLLYHPGPLIDSEVALQEAVARLVALDPDIVNKLIEIGGPPPLRRQEPGFAGLVRIIVAQQVSTASANAIFKRVETLLNPLSAKTLVAAGDETLRACGLSTPKMRALRALAQAVAGDGLDLAALGALVAEEAHRALIVVKGIGPWTADVFLLFCLGHPDSFPAGDLALQEAAKLALGLKRRPDARKLAEIAERWRPLRGVAARLLWAYYRAQRQRVGMALAAG